LNPLLLNSGILEQSRQYSRVPEGREYPTIALTLELKNFFEGQFLPQLAQGVSLPIFDDYKIAVEPGRGIVSSRLRYKKGYGRDVPRRKSCSVYSISIVVGGVWVVSIQSANDNILIVIAPLSQFEVG
jgi:hypothetical protein